MFLKKSKKHVFNVFYLQINVFIIYETNEDRPTMSATEL